MRRTKTRTIIIVILVILLLFNSGLLFSYYNFYLSDKISEDIIEIKNENYEKIYYINSLIKKKDINHVQDILKKYVKEHGGYVSLKNADGNIIYTNKKDINKLFSSTVFLMIDNVEYELTYCQVAITAGFRLIKNFMRFEIFLFVLTVVLIFLISSKNFIGPIEMIVKDINDYKYGIIPKKRSMHKQLTEIQNSFVDMVDKLEMEKQYKNQIIASISHDLKTPLTSVIGYADRLKNNKLDEDKKTKYIDKIYGKSLLMKNILEEFDDYNSLNLKKSIKFKEILIDDLCNSIIKDYEDELMDKNIILTVKSNCKDKTIYIDDVKMKRVFSNIISNSVTHFKGEAGKIDINISFKNNSFRIDIKDNGGGIDDEGDLKKIFEPLYTSDPSRKIFGLGLAICKQIVTSHNGYIYAVNNDIGGLSIVIILPNNISTS